MFFIKKFKFKFVMIMAYNDNVNMIKTHRELPKAIGYLKKEFEMKGFGKQNFILAYRLSIQILKYLFIKKITSKRS